MGRTGDIEVVGPLNALIDGWINSAVELAAKDAIRQIQARQLGAEAGQLSVADSDEEGGALSIAEGADAPAKPDPSET